MTTNYIGKTLLHLQTVDSTNTYLSNLAKAGTLVEGTLISTHEQTNGKGQRNQQWNSQAGKNLTASIFLQTHFLRPEQQFYLSKVIALGVLEFVKSLLSPEHQVKIKWANDIYVEDKKIAGILIENTIRGNALGYSIVGIGVNINQLEFDSQVLNPVSLSQITHQNYDLDHCLNLLCEFIEQAYEQLKSGNLNLINESYISNLYRFNEFHWFDNKAKKMFRKIVGIEENGWLILEDEAGQKKNFEIGQIRFVI